MILIAEMNDVGIKEPRKQFLSHLRIYDGFRNIVVSELNGYLLRILKVGSRWGRQTLSEKCASANEVDRFWILIIEINDSSIEEPRKPLLGHLRIYGGFWNIVESELTGYLRRILKVGSRGALPDLFRKTSAGR